MCSLCRSSLFPSRRAADYSVRSAKHVAITSSITGCSDCNVRSSRTMRSTVSPGVAPKGTMTSHTVCPPGPSTLYPPGNEPIVAAARSVTSPMKRAWKGHPPSQCSATSACRDFSWPGEQRQRQNARKCAHGGEEAERVKSFTVVYVVRQTQSRIRSSLCRAAQELKREDTRKGFAGVRLCFGIALQRLVLNSPPSTYASR